MIWNNEVLIPLSSTKSTRSPFIDLRWSHIAWVSSCKIYSLRSSCASFPTLWSLRMSSFVRLVNKDKSYGYQLRSNRDIWVLRLTVAFPLQNSINRPYDSRSCEQRTRGSSESSLGKVSQLSLAQPLDLLSETLVRVRNWPELQCNESANSKEIFSNPYWIWRQSSLWMCLP